MHIASLNVATCSIMPTHWLASFICISYVHITAGLCVTAYKMAHETRVELGGIGFYWLVTDVLFPLCFHFYFMST